MFFGVIVSHIQKIVIESDWPECMAICVHSLFLFSENVSGFLFSVFILFFF